MTKTFHYTFRTYKKMQVLEGEIAKDLGLLLEEICKSKGFELIAFSVLVDHVHILIRKGITDSNEYVMKMVKGISSREIFKKYPGNRFEFGKLWGRSYHAVEVKGQEDLATKIDYINNQKIDGIDKRALGGRKPASEPDWKPRRSVSGFQSSKEKVGSDRSVSGFQSSKENVGSDRSVPGFQSSRQKGL